MVVKHERTDCDDSNMLDKNKMQPQVTFIQALNDKYVDQVELDNQFKLPKDDLITSEITFVGFGIVSSIQKQLRSLMSIDISNRNIDSAGDLTKLKGSLDRVRTLNLAHNHLKWSDIVEILPYLPNLQELVLTGNDLRDAPDFCSPPSKRLSLLSIGRINLQCDQLFHILSRVWTCIDQLDIWDNNLSIEQMKLGPNREHDSGDFIKSMVSLKLSHNKLPSFVWIDSGWLTTSLSELDVSHCGLKSMEFSPEALRCLQSLEILNISYNCIEDWTSVSNLNSLRNLKSLMCTDNPFYLCEKMAKLFTIARISKLRRLNREEITSTIRRDAEIFYLRKIFPEYRDFKDGKYQTFMSIHPRYEEIANEYGLPEDLSPKKVVDKYLTVHLCHEDQSITKKLPCDMRISNLQMLCKKLFKLNQSCNIVIIYTKSESPGKEISYPLDKEGQTLHFFSLENDCKLQIKADE